LLWAKNQNLFFFHEQMAMRPKKKVLFLLTDEKKVFYRTQISVFFSTASAVTDYEKKRENKFG
jgi:hypothetical protein